MLKSDLFKIPVARALARQITDKNTAKRRSALVVSNGHTFNAQVGQSVLAMITSAKNSNWPLDSAISDLDVAGLSSPSIIRMKLFTLPHQLIIRKAGHLSIKDKQQVKANLSALLDEE